MFLAGLFITVLYSVSILIAKVKVLMNSSRHLHLSQNIFGKVLCGMWIAKCGISKRCILRTSPAEIFCGIKIAENVLVVEFCQLNKCTILQSTLPPCSQASFCLAGWDFIIVLVGLFSIRLIIDPHWICIISAGILTCKMCNAKCKYCTFVVAMNGSNMVSLSAQV